MKNDKLLLLIVLIYFSIASGYCQKGNDFVRNQLQEIKDEKSFLTDTLFMAYTNVADKYVKAEIINNGSDTVFLFSSYLKEDKYFASCLQRVDEVNMEYKVSFVPIIPYLGVRTSDRVILSAESICNLYQTKYEFVKLSPRDSFSFILDLEKVFKKTLEIGKAYQDQSPFELSKFDEEFELEEFDVGNLSKCYRLILEVAIYKNIDVFKDEEIFYLKEFEFDKKSKDFEIHQMELGVKSFREKI